jgi:hypothetical protein
MRLSRAVPALLLLGSLVAFQPATAGSRGAGGQTEGCIEKEWGYRCFYGPFHVRYDPEEDDDAFDLIEPVPKAGYITSMYATLVDEDGDAVSRHEAHLHHVVLANPNKTNLMCGSRIPGDFFFGSGKERTRMELPEGYGYYWDGKSPTYYPSHPPTWAMAYHLMTMHEGHETDVFVRLDLGFEDVAEGSLIDVTPLWLDVTDCSVDPIFNVPKGSGTGGVFKKSLDMTVPEGGRMVALGGHLHDGGLKLRLDNLTTGERLFVSRPTYGKANGGWDLRKMSSFSGTDGPIVDALDEVRLTASYDSTHRWHKVMGIMVGALAPVAEQKPSPRL